MVDSGDYYIDDAGNIYTYDPINSGWEITYEPEVPGSVHETDTFKVIPDPGSHSNWGYRGLKLQYKNESNNPPLIPLKQIAWFTIFLINNFTQISTQLFCNSFSYKSHIYSS